SQNQRRSLMDSIDADKARAALAQLEAERQRRIDAGEVAIVPLVLVGETVEDAQSQVESARALKTEELRAAGEQRPIHFDVTLVVTAPDADDAYQSPTTPTVARASGETTGSPSAPEPVASGEERASPPLPAIPPTFVSIEVRQRRDDGIDMGHV